MSKRIRGASSAYASVLGLAGARMSPTSEQQVSQSDSTVQGTYWCVVTYWDPTPSRRRTRDRDRHTERHSLSQWRQCARAPSWCTSVSPKIETLNDWESMLLSHTCQYNVFLYARLRCYGISAASVSTSCRIHPLIQDVSLRQVPTRSRATVYGR